MPAAIRAAISPNILKKADRLFRNDDAGTFAEVLQNARRAGATIVDITFEQSTIRTDHGIIAHVAVTVEDNGKGVTDFQRLLTLGDSGWDETTQAAEDPAGMGFYSLCQSGVEVSSGYQYCRIKPEVFLGGEDALVEQGEEYIAGTRLKFTRHSGQQSLTEALHKVALFCPLDIRLNGESLPKQDFLAGALHREVIDGIEVGFATSFAHGWNPYRDDNWNFYGLRLHDMELKFSGVISPADLCSSGLLHARFNVIETGRIKLQLPDRRSVIQNDFLTQFTKKVRAAAYRCFQKLGQHQLPYKCWLEAKDLGVELPESVHVLTSWSAGACDDGIEYVFGPDKTSLVTDLTRGLLLDRDLENRHTLDAALHSGATLDADLYHERPEFIGYSWYDALPCVVNIEVFLDDIPATNHDLGGPQTRPKKIELIVTIQKQGEPDCAVLVAGHIHVESEEWNEIRFAAVTNSPWDNEELSGPFPLDEFLMSATFQSSDDSDADRWETQMEYHREQIEGELNRYFRGPRATLLAVLRKTFTSEASLLCDDLQISEVTFRRPASTHGQWNIELVPTSAPTTS